MFFVAAFCALLVLCWVLSTLLRTCAEFAVVVVQLFAILFVVSWRGVLGLFFCLHFKNKMSFCGVVNSLACLFCFFSSLTSFVSSQVPCVGILCDISP